MQYKNVTLDGERLNLYHYAEKRDLTVPDEIWGYTTDVEQFDFIPADPDIQAVPYDDETRQLLLSVGEDWQFERDLSYDRKTFDEWKSIIKCDNILLEPTVPFVYHAAISHAHTQESGHKPFVEKLFTALVDAKLDVFFDDKYEEDFEDAIMKDCVAQFVRNIYSCQSLWEIIILDDDYLKGHGDHNWRICLLEASTIFGSSVTKNSRNVIVIQTDKETDSKLLDSFPIIIPDEVTWFNTAETSTENIIHQCVDKVKTIPASIYEHGVRVSL